MSKSPLKKGMYFLVVSLVAGTLLSIGSLGGAQTTVTVGQCTADSQGRLPPDGSCVATIPGTTTPGQYILRANGTGVQAGSDPTYPPQEGTLNVQKNRLFPGESTSVFGGGFKPGSKVTLTLERSGALAFGRLSLIGEASAQEPVRTLSARITVVERDNAVVPAGTTTSGGRTGGQAGSPLSRTGLNALGFLLLGGALIGAGLGFRTWSRRRTAVEDAAQDY